MLPRKKRRQNSSRKKKRKKKNEQKQNNKLYGIILVKIAAKSENCFRRIPFKKDTSFFAINWFWIYSPRPHVTMSVKKMKDYLKDIKRQFIKKEKT